jgi:hypothetical protein
MKHRLLPLIAAMTLVLATASTAAASGGNYTFAGGTPAEQDQVRDALNASSFDWNLLPETVTVNIVPGAGDCSTPGEVYLDPALLDMGTFSWGVVLHEFGHQVDFELLTQADRAVLGQSLGGLEWWPPGAETLPTDDYASERFASTLAWSYWQSPENSLHPSSTFTESAAMAPAAFEALLDQLLGGSTTNEPLVSAASDPTSVPTVPAAPHKVKAAKEHTPLRR